MATIRAFKGLRPKPELCEKVASFPYDVINSKEARVLAQGNPHSLLHVSKPEIDLPESIDVHDEKVYAKARENFQKFLNEKILVQDTEPHLYIYKQKMGNHEQYGLVGCASADEYYKEIIKKHELTRKDKEDDRTRHTMEINCNTGPVFLAYRDQKEIDKIVADYVKNNKPENDFVKEDGIGHTFWVIKDKSVIEKITVLFKKVDYLYIADGHHRSASAARAQIEKRKKDPNPNSEKEYNFFLAVYFPATQLKIMDYNRLLLTLNGNTKESFMKKLQEKFEIIGTNTDPKPKKQTEFGMYFDGTWYQIRAKKGSFNENDPIESLDVSILQQNLLDPVFGIKDPRTSKDIDFVGGIRGPGELKKRVDSGEGKVAFQMYPTTMEQLISVADAGKIMPPKSTWFEPKLRSGMVLHLLD